MKRLNFISTFIFIIVGFSVQAQTKSPYESTQSINNPVAKGYYSIGNNNAKLPAGVQLGIKEEIADASPKKGYYSIGRNYRKEKKTVVESGLNKQVPRVTKGYYSIGNNAEKL